jgi:hypothetical protein
MDRWWAEFESKTKALDDLFNRRAKWDLPAWMHAHLNAIHPKLMWEFGPGVGGGHRLVITPESHRELRPLVKTLLERAPKIPGWQFYSYRLAEDVDGTVATVSARTGVDIANAMACASLGKFGRIDLKFVCPTFVLPNEKKAVHAAFVATETLLGEEVLDKWIGVIDAVPAGGKDRALPLSRLKPSVDALIGSIQEQMFPKPCWEMEDMKWTLWKLKPKKQKDYPGQLDLFVGKSMLQDMWQVAHGNMVFYSSSFSKFDEVFCYVKLDGSQGLDSEKFGDKAEIEDALDGALKPARVGCVIGGGTGVRYSYVDLALTNLPRGIEIVRKVLQEGNIHRRSWILFYDAELVNEWIGIWDDSPPPP